MDKTPWGHIHPPPPPTLRAHDMGRRAAAWEARVVRYRCMHMYLCIHAYIYVYTCMYMCTLYRYIICVYVYKHERCSACIIQVL